MDNIIPIEEKLLLKLPAAEMADRLMAVPAPKRLDMLLARTDAEEVVAALPPQDFYLFVKELGAESSMPLLSLCQAEQFSHIIDLEGWRGDVVNAGKVLVWYTTLMRADETKFLNWLYSADFEFLVLLFKNWLDEVKVAGEEDFQEESDTLPKSTIDNQYYFSVRYPDYEEVIRFILSFLFEHHQAFYQALLHDVRFVLVSEVEELAYRFHRGRLEDNAIPDFEEARSIYRAMTAASLSQDKKMESGTTEEHEWVPSFAVLHVPQQGIFADALSKIQDHRALDVLRQELVALANKVLVADGLDFEEPDNLRQSVDKAVAYLNLGLEEIAGLDTRLAARCLREHFLEELFRLGHAKTEKVLRPLRSIVLKGWLADWPEGINLLETRWQEEIGLLTAQTPMLLRRGPEGAEREDYIRYRLDCRQIEDETAMLEDMECIYEDICRQQLSDWADFAGGLWKKGQNSSLAEVTIGRLLFTAAAWQAWQGKWLYEPLPLKKWPDIFAALATVDLKKIIVRKIEDMNRDGSMVAHAAAYLAPLFVEFDEEMRWDAAAPTPDPGIVPFFLFGSINRKAE